MRQPVNGEPAEVAGLTVADAGRATNDASLETMVQESAPVPVGVGDLIHHINPEQPFNGNLNASLLPGLPHNGLGWMLPRLDDFSTSRSYFSWLQGGKTYDLDARIKGGERHMIMSGEYDRVLPMDIYGEYLVKSILSGNIDSQEQLGIYEVSPEDFALAEFVDSSKLPLQKIVRQGLAIQNLDITKSSQM